MLDLKAEQALEHQGEIDLLLVTATDTETEALHTVLEPFPGLGDVARTHIENHTYRLGKFGAFCAAHLQCVMGTRDAGSAMIATIEAGQCWTPRAIVMLGIAWGSPRVRKLGLGDVLVASSAQDFENVRVGEIDEFRSSETRAGPKLLDRFRNVNGWECSLPDGRTSAQRPGLVLSGDKLVAKAKFRDKLLNEFTRAIGGDMESYAVAQACRALAVEWIAVKGVCDWGDEDKDDTWQHIAAEAAVSLCLAALRNPSALDGLGIALQLEPATVRVSTAGSQHPCEIPPVTDRVVGRETERRELVDGLSDESQGMALCFVRGMGGMGKTFLAAEAAREVFAEGTFPGGVVWHEAYEQSPTQVMAHVVTALEGAIPSSEPVSIQAAYRRLIQEREVLIVVDNALSVNQVVRLLSESPGSAILVTSRNHMPTLRQRASAVVELKRMSNEEAVELLSGKSNLPQTDHGVALARIAGLCGFLPLALSIAGALLSERDMWPSVESFERRLEKHRLDCLAIDGCSDQDVRAVLLLSYEGMDAALAKTFRSLSILGRASFGASAVALMLDQDKDTTITDLARLIGRSVLERSLLGRYVMHDLLRDLAGELLGKDEPAATAVLLRRRADAYWSTWQEALRLGSLAAAYAKKGDADKAIEYYDKAQALNEEIGDRQGRASAYGGIAAAYAKKGDADKAIEYHEKSRALNEEIGDRQGRASAYGGIAAAYAKKGDADKAIEYHEKSRALNEEIGDRQGLAASLGGIAAAYAKKGDADKAIEYYEQAATIQRSIGDRYHLAASLGGTAAAYAKKGDADKAIEYYEQAATIQRSIGDRYHLAASLGGTAAAYAKKGDADKAIEYYEKPRALSEEIGDRHGLAASLGGIAAAYAKKGDADKAIEYYEQAATIQRSIGDRYHLAASLGGTAAAYAKKGDADKAIEYYEQAATIQRSIDDRYHLCMTLAGMMRAAWRVGDQTRAENCSLEMHQLGCKRR